MNKLVLKVIVGVILVPVSLISINANAMSMDRYMEIMRDISGDGTSSVKYTCNDSFSDRVNEKISTLIPNVCAQLDTDASIDGMAYENPHNPSKACDMGVPMVGMPDWDGFGFSSDGIDACGIAKMVVGDHIRGGVEKWNQVNDIINDGLSASEGFDFDKAVEKLTGN